MTQVQTIDTGATRIVRHMQLSDKPQRQEPSLRSASNCDVSISDNVEIPKKVTRNRLTREERQHISKQCFDRYLQGWSSKLIAHDLGIRESVVKESLFVLINQNPDKIIKTNVFLASANTRMKEIDMQSVADFYKVEITEDGTRICRPLVVKSETGE